MPRLVFGNLSAYETWIKDHVDSSPEAKPRFDMYITAMFDAVLIPKVSTSPRLYATYRGTDKQMIEVRRITKEMHIPLYDVRAVEWDTEKQVGVTVKH